MVLPVVGFWGMFLDVPTLWWHEAILVWLVGWVDFSPDNYTCSGLFFVSADHVLNHVPQQPWLEEKFLYCSDVLLEFAFFNHLYYFQLGNNFLGLFHWRQRLHARGFQMAVEQEQLRMLLRYRLKFLVSGTMWLQTYQWNLLLRCIPKLLNLSNLKICLLYSLMSWLSKRQALTGS